MRPELLCVPSAGSAEYTNSFSVERSEPSPDEFPGYDKTIW